MIIMKPIKDYDGYYVTEDGRVWSDKSKKFLKVRDNGTGYLYVGLKKDVQYNRYIHRLVAETFIPNPNNLPCVNHKDEDKTNNKVENLEWCSYEYNNNYGCHNQKIADKASKAIVQLDKYGNVIREWKSAREVENTLGIANQNIAKVLKGKRKRAGGYGWKYIDK